MGYLTPALIEQRIAAIAAAHPTLCTAVALPFPSVEGRTMSCLRIAGGTATKRVGVALVGGIHAREWAPPDALLSLADMLATAYDANASLSHAEFVDASTPPTATYPAFRTPPQDVRRILDAIDLYVLPCANPDGREFSMAAMQNLSWRKNRRPAAGSACVGVDLNRNFDIAWDFERYFSPAAVAAGLNMSKDPCHFENFIGSGPASEPETRNVQWLINEKRIVFYLDVHSYSRQFLYPWGMDDNQSSDDSKNYRNAQWDRSGPTGGRDGKTGTLYGEWMPGGPPEDFGARQSAIAGQMRDAILQGAGTDPVAIARSQYTVQQENGLYPVTGDSCSYAFSRVIEDSSRFVYAAVMECGSLLDGENGFQPNYVTKFPKIEREVHQAALVLLSVASEWVRPINCTCAFLDGIYGGRATSNVAYLRAARSRLRRGPAPIAGAMRVIEAGYRRASPWVVDQLRAHPRVASSARRFVVDPVVAVLRRIWRGPSRPDE